jgi:hypothetical protein
MNEHVDGLTSFACLDVLVLGLRVRVFVRGDDCEGWREERKQAEIEVRKMRKK